MKKTGFWFGGLGISTGAAATVLFLLNLAVWSLLTAMLGGAMALIGLGLIIWALYPIRGAAKQVVEDETAYADQRQLEPTAEMPQAKAA